MHWLEKLLREAWLGCWTAFCENDSSAARPILLEAAGCAGCTPRGASVLINCTPSHALPAPLLVQAAGLFVWVQNAEE